MSVLYSVSDKLADQFYSTQKRDLASPFYVDENHDIAIAMSSSRADPMLGLNILQG